MMGRGVCTYLEEEPPDRGSDKGPGENKLRRLQAARRSQWADLRTGEQGEGAGHLPGHLSQPLGGAS